MNSLESINIKTRQAYNLAADKYHDLFHNEMNEKEYDRMLLDLFANMLKPFSLICDAGCGPSGHIGKYLKEKGINVMGVDISDRCVELAKLHNPETQFICEDISQLSFPEQHFDGIVSYYSIINTPKKYVNRIFTEFHRVLKPGGYLLVTVKEGSDEGLINELIGIEAEIYFSHFSESEIREFYSDSGFELVFIETRNPYDFEIRNDRISAIGKKISKIKLQL